MLSFIDMPFVEVGAALFAKARSLAVVVAVFLSLVLSATGARAEKIKLPVLNLANLEEADDFAKKFVSEYLKKFKDIPVEQWDPIVLLHMGKKPTRQLKWVAEHMADAKIPVHMEMIDPDEMEAAIDIVEHRALNDALLLNQDGKLDNDPGNTLLIERRSGIKRIAKRAHLYLRWLTHLPNGFTTLIKIDRNHHKKISEAGVATFSSLMAGASVAFSFYLTQKSGVDANALKAALVTTVMVWYNVYKSADIGELMTRPKVVKIGEKGKYEATHSRLFNMVASTFKSLIENTIIAACAFDWDKAFSSETIEANILNSTINLFAKGWINDWLSSKKPTLQENGKFVADVAKGQWPLMKWLAVNAGVNVAYNFGKIMHFLGHGPIVEGAYYLLGAIGIWKIGWKERFEIRSKLEWLKQLLMGWEVQSCQTLVLHQKFKLPPEPVEASVSK